MARNFTFTNQKPTREIEELYERVSNPMDAFIDECCDLDMEAFIPKDEFKTKLKDWMRNQGYRIWSDKEIIQYMRDKGIDDRKIMWTGVRKNSWLGIKWK